jgi:AraC family ethanolamine operon transcriptional activator
MLTFNDFDAWADTIRGANLQLACDRVEERTWSIGMRQIGDLSVQAASEGGGNLCYGVNTTPGTLLFLPVTRVGHHVANCDRLDENAVLVIPPGSDFRIMVRQRAHAWCSVALPSRTAANPAAGAGGSRVCRPADGGARQLRNLIARIFASPALETGDSAAATVAAVELAAAATACLGVSAMPRRGVGRPRIDRSEIVRRSLAALEATAVGRPSVAGLADQVGVTERTLCRAFHDTFGVSPLRYIALRQLHHVRRSLRTAPPDTTVAQVLVQHGIWDFGRFAGRYRRHFGEMLSTTLHRGCR